MISRDDLEVLLERRAVPGSAVLTVYLDTDQSREINIERACKIVLKDMLREIEHGLATEQRKEFEADAERVRQFVAEHRDLKRGLVICCDVSEDFFWFGELNVRVPNTARWIETPYLRPLIEILDEYERYCVVLTDRNQARLFAIDQGEIDEYRESSAKAAVAHKKSAGTDHLRSQMISERKSDERAHWHLKHVAELTFRLARNSEFDRLILAGPAEATSELSGLLPKWLRARVVRQIPLSIGASEAQVLEETLKVEEEVEREREKELVEELINASAEDQRAVLELGATLRAIREQRVWQLVYVENFSQHGSRCSNCGALFAAKNKACDYCGQAVYEVSDLIDRAVSSVLELGGKVEQVRGEAATRLQAAGSIGALLRY